MMVFADLTLLEPSLPRRRWYLWTDAVAICIYLELFNRTGSET